jgi:V8-like Glu-specific endopeptidase
VPFHHCTASVVGSPRANVVLAAAHCLSGSGAGLSFAPGYSRGSAPYGRWTVTAAFVDPAWRTAQNPARDYAFLVVAPALRDGVWRNVQDVVGGAQLGTTPPAGAPVQVSGYVAGSDDDQIGCPATTYRTAGYPAFDCGGFAGGTSGSPWLLSPVSSVSGGTVVGAIGGLHQGGCLASTSYSAPFDAATRAVYARAASGAPGDLLPAPGSDGC